RPRYPGPRCPGHQRRHGPVHVLSAGPRRSHLRRGRRGSQERGGQAHPETLRADVVTLPVSEAPMSELADTTMPVRPGEDRVLSRLCEVYAPAPRPYVYCADETVLGVTFYVMERKRGIILRKTLPAGLGLDAAAVRRLCAAAVENLAALHALDYRAIGLGDL